MKQLNQNKMKQTAVEFLAENMLYLSNEIDMKFIDKNEYQAKRKGIIEQAKEMEKEQELKEWIEVWSLGYDSGFDNCKKKYKTKKTRTMIEKIKFQLIQFKWYRKCRGGSYYLIYNWLPMVPFWSDKLITSCGGRAIEKEVHPNKSE